MYDHLSYYHIKRDSIIPLGQKNTLAEYMILSGADNRPPMLDKDLYDSWKSRMELYMQNREHGRMILESVENGPLIWHTVEENGVTKTKKYAKLSAAEKIQANCDMKETNIILQGFAVLVFSPGDDPIACLNKAMAFITAVASLRGDKGKVILVLVIRILLLVLGETMQVDKQRLLNATTVKVKDIWLGNALILSDQGMQHGIRKNVELENSVAKLLLENEHLCNEINHMKQDLKAQIQDKVFLITSLKDDLRKVKRKEIVDIAAQIPSANTIVLGMFKLDLEPLALRLLQNMEAHIDYLKYTQEQADILRGIVEQAKVKQPLDNELDFACCPNCSLISGLRMFETMDRETALSS
ncbi:hypothetical protein Tco_0822695 [Tanacetum coccineum]|uniref:Uncharacterized protein n=1 Tax=Tanacetum coccineum TaxID=301880 RepID=A0ABQ5AGT9_9ASTR